MANNELIECPESPTGICPSLDCPIHGDGEDEYDQTGRNFSAVWCDSCAIDVTHRFSPSKIEAWIPAADDYEIKCPECGQKAVHQHSFNV